jgi:CRISPR-associated protein Csm3
MANESAALQGSAVISGKIKVLTGLRIGGQPVGIEIGGIDNVVIRNPLNNEPYVPGSSLKGKMRSLFERFTHAEINHRIQDIRLHSCHDDKDDGARYKTCRVCHIFGLPGEGRVKAAHPTPLIVRDVKLDRDSLPGVDNFTEVKWEAAIDRITSAAVPRQMERVPEGAVFKPLDIVFNIYREEDLARLPDLLMALQLVEDDYLGGLGSRGSGKVKFEDLKLTCRRPDEEKRHYVVSEAREIPNLPGAIEDQELWKWVSQQILPKG